MKITRVFAPQMVAAFLCVQAFPVHAGIFDVNILGGGAAEKTSEKPKLVGDETIAQIRAAFDDQRYAEAGKLLDQAIILAGDEDPRLAYWAGQLSITRGRYDDALANFKKVGAGSGLEGLALEGQGIALSQMGRSDEALKTLQAAVANDPAAWRAWNALGSEYDRRHDWSSADMAYGNAIEKSGGAAIALNNRGFSRLSQNRSDDAILDFVAALQKKPDLAPARNNLRLAMAVKGEYDRAIRGATANDQAAILNNAGFAAILRGDYAKAKELLTQAMKEKGGYYARAAENLSLAQSRSTADARTLESP